MTFPCTSCGACCSSINDLDFLQVYNNQGTCIKLVNNQCSIYENRPLLCRIDDSYEALFSQVLSKKAFYIQNALACNALQEKLNIPSHFRIDLHQFNSH